MKNNVIHKPPFKVEKTLIIAGNQAQLFIQKEPLYIHYGQKPPPRSESPTKSPSSISRTRLALFRLVNCNLHQYGKIKPTFCTLTYKKNETNRKKASSDLRLYHQRLSYYTNTSLRYVAIPEFQKRGAVHYHVIFFDFGFFPVLELKRLWGFGSVDIEKIDHPDNVSAYITAYITKENLDSRFYGQKAFFCSRGLLRPVTEYDNLAIDKALDDFITNVPFGYRVETQITITQSSTIYQHKYVNRNNYQTIIKVRNGTKRDERWEGLQYYRAIQRT